MNGNLLSNKMTTWNIAFAWKVSVNSICSQGMSDFFPYTFQGMCSGAASPRIRSLSFQLCCGMVKDLRSCFREEPLTYFSISGNNSWGKKKIQSEFHVCIAVQDCPSSVFCWEMPRDFTSVCSFREFSSLPPLFHIALLIKYIYFTLL